VNRKSFSKGNLLKYILGLADRVSRIRVCCGDWSRVCGPALTMIGLTAVFLDPPYGVEDRSACYDDTEDFLVASTVRKWAAEQGGSKLMRIAYCGLDVEGEELESAGWSCMKWNSHGGYSSGHKGRDRRGVVNSLRECIWFSPSCVAPDGVEPMFSIEKEDQDE
jgi:hypothetical protein